MGNTASILNMLRKIGVEAEISLEEEKIRSSKAYILPGVGAFDNGVTKLRSSGLFEILEEMVNHEKKPFLGICLGMQMLFDSSEEGTERGLGWLPGDVSRFDFSSISNSNKIPHMGWNEVSVEKENPLFNGLTDENRFYFVHSFHVNCSDPSNISGTSHYGYNFPCSVQKGNIFGAQFHPEKSHRFGMQFMKNLSEFAQC
jgi:glutamine amidotransferase